MSAIPEKDVRLIEDVADHVARNNPVATYPVDDLRQEMVIYGIQSYSKWDESKHSHKNESKRDKNLRLFLKDYMIKRIKNMYKAVSTNKRAVNINVVSFDYHDPVYESVLLEDEERKLTEIDFRGLGLDDEEIKVLLYISDNGLGKNGSKKDLVEDLGVEKNKINEIMGNLRENNRLKEYLEEHIQPI